MIQFYNNSSNIAIRILTPYATCLKYTALGSSIYGGNSSCLGSGYIIKSLCIR